MVVLGVVGAESRGSSFLYLGVDQGRKQPFRACS